MHQQPTQTCPNRLEKCPPNSSKYVPNAPTKCATNVRRDSQNVSMFTFDYKAMGFFTDLTVTEGWNR